MITCSCCFVCVLFPSCCFEGRDQWLWHCSPTRKHLSTKIIFFKKKNIISFHTVVRLLFLQLRSTIKPLKREAYKVSKMIFLNLALFGSPDESGCSVLCSLMPFKHHRRLFVFNSLAFFTRLEMLDKNCSVLCSEICPVLLSGRWWKHLSLSGFRWGNLVCRNISGDEMGWKAQQVSRMGFQTYSFIICIVPYCSHVN